MISPTVGWVIVLASLAQNPAESAGRSASVTLSGKVVSLSTALKAKGLPADDEPIAKQVVLQDAENGLTPLLSDEASRALFLDKRLRDRPAELKARRYAGVPYVQVVSFRVEHEGSLRTPEYFCDVCTISVRYPQICPCCQGPMVLRMRPESPSEK